MRIFVPVVYIKHYRLVVDFFFIYFWSPVHWICCEHLAHAECFLAIYYNKKMKHVKYPKKINQITPEKKLSIDFVRKLLFPIGTAFTWALLKIFFIHSIQHHSSCWCSSPMKRPFTRANKIKLVYRSRSGQFKEENFFFMTELNL